MGNDSKLGMVMGLGVVVAVAFLAFPKVPEGIAPGATAISPKPILHAASPVELSLTSQPRDGKPGQAIIVPLRRKAAGA